VIDWCSWS